MRRYAGTSLQWDFFGYPHTSTAVGNLIARIFWSYSHVFALLSLVFVAASLKAQDPTAMVIGFERFARHEEIPAAQAGQLLVTELGCTACHASSNELHAAKKAPALNSAGQRLNARWLEQYISSPSSIHPGTTMPDLLSSLPTNQRENAVRALVAFLSLQREAYPEIKASGANPVPLEFYDRGDADNGKRLFHTVGCVACHEPDNKYDVPQVQPSDLDKMLDTLDPEELKELGLSSSARRVPSIPFAGWSAGSSGMSKYSRKSLTYFLMNPESTHPAGRMPSFGLKPVEAADLAAYLVGGRRVDSLAASKNDALVNQGRALFNELHCNNCHQLQDKPTFKAKPLNSLDVVSESSCTQLSEKASKAVRKRAQPVYRLDTFQIQSIDQFVQLQRQPAGRPNSAKASDLAADRLQLTLLQLNCYACHDRNTLGGVDRFRKPYFETVNHVDIGDEGRLPPSLSNVGKKLKPEWIEKVLKGEGAIRPHMTIRMPQYGKTYVKELPGYFGSIDGSSQVVNTLAKGDPVALKAAGRQLMDLGCVQCHSYRGNALPGVIGVDLAEIDKRIQPQYLYDFLKDPGSLKSRTRMPTFFPDGKSQFPDILGGNVETQIAAMVAYLSDLKNQPLPQKIEDARSQSFELSPKDYPIVLRTFMPVGGFHAIAVGFPEKIHFAFDSQRCNIAEAWQGKFIDAETTWFDRFAKPVEPLGSSRIRFPSGVPIALSPSKSSTWPSDTAAGVRFEGYALDSNRIPTFHYVLKSERTSQSIEVHDTVKPKMDSQGSVIGLLRTIELSPKGAANLQPADTNKSSKANNRNSQGGREELVVRLLTGKRISRAADPSGLTGIAGSFANDEGLTVSIIGSSKPDLRNQPGQAELVVSMGAGLDQPVKLELVYRWKGVQ